MEIEDEVVRRVAWEKLKEADWHRDDVTVSQPSVKDAVERSDVVDDPDDFHFIDGVQRIEEAVKELGCADYDSLYQDLMDAPYTFTALSGGARVYANHEKESITSLAHRNGFMVRNVKPIPDGEFNVEVHLEDRRYVATMARSTEMIERVKEGGD